MWQWDSYGERRYSVGGAKMCEMGNALHAAEKMEGVRCFRGRCMTMNI